MGLTPFRDVCQHLRVATSGPATSKTSCLREGERVTPPRGAGGGGKPRHVKGETWGMCCGAGDQGRDASEDDNRGESVLGWAWRRARGTEDGRTQRIPGNRACQTGTEHGMFQGPRGMGWTWQARRTPEHQSMEFTSGAKPGLGKPPGDFIQNTSTPTAAVTRW